MYNFYNATLCDLREGEWSAVETGHKTVTLLHQILAATREKVLKYCPIQR